MEELSERNQQIWIGSDADTQEAGHEMRVDHRVLQLSPLSLDAGGHRLTGEFGQYQGEGHRRRRGPADGRSGSPVRRYAS
jgi:hypothetical protein